MAQSLDRQTDRIAYICLCHQDPKFIARLARTLSYQEDGLFVHVDKKVNIDPFVEACKEMKNVHFVITEREKSYWGGFNAIKATMNTIKLAMQTNRYNRFIMLQGQDYPLFHPAEIHRFFVDNDKEYCRARNLTTSQDTKDKWKIRGFWVNDCKFKIIRRFFAIMSRLGLTCRPKKFRNGKGDRWDIYKGWAQFALTRECVEHLVEVYERNQRFNRYIKHCFPPDEIYIHTVIHNSKFKDKVSSDVIFNRDGAETLLNLTYFEYCNAVTVFQSKSDYSWLKEIGCLFVRKVNSTSTELLDEIDKNIKTRQE